MTVGERLNYLRKELLKLTLDQFGNKIGLKKSALSHIENGNVNITEQNRKSICREFNVNDTWLMAGEGEPFIKKTQHDEIAEFINKIETDDDKFKLELIAMLSQFKDADWELFKKMVKKLAKLDDPAGTGLEDKSVEELEEIYKKEVLSAPSEPGATA